MIAAPVGGGVVGSACGFVGQELGTHVPRLPVIGWWLIAIVALAYGLAELGGLRWWLPQRHWQVPQSWGRHGRVAYAAAFGVVLGAGFLTFVPYVGYHLLLGVCVVGADPQRGGMLMVIFGMARAAPVLLGPLLTWMGGGTFTVATTATINTWATSVDGRAGAFKVAVLAAVAGSAAVMALGKL